MCKQKFNNFEICKKMYMCLQFVLLYFDIMFSANTIFVNVKVQGRYHKTGLFSLQTAAS